MKQELKAAIDGIARQTSLTSSEADMLMERAFALADTDEDRREAGAYLVKAIGSRKRPDVDVKAMMGEATEALNLSYIAKRYFNKSKTWLYQRLNQSVVNGKPAAFSEQEIKRLSDFLEELSNKIHQISVQLSFS